MGPMPLLPCPPENWPSPLCALQQHPAYGRAVAELGADVHTYRFEEAGQDLARLQLIRRRIGPLPLTWLARGPVWATPPDTAAMRTLLAALPGLPLVAPDTADQARALRAAGLRPLMTAQTVAELDLTQPEAQRLARQHGKWRNRLRKAQTMAPTVTHRRLNPARDAALLGLEFVQRQTRRYSALPPAFTTAWARQNPKGTRLFLARDGHDTLAYLLVLLHRPVATYHIGWTGPAGRTASAHHLLLWQASCWLAKQGYLRFDLGSIDTETAPGLARFKLGSGATPRALGPTMAGLPRLFPKRIAA